jgi:hypothetical protein
LRQALINANDGDTINFEPSISSITLTTAELVIDKSVSIIATPDMVTVQRLYGSPEFRIFHVLPGQTVTMQYLRITGGNPEGVPGGGILNDHSSLFISNCSLMDNNGWTGGAIANLGMDGKASVAISDSSITGNLALWFGGGIYSDDGTLTITNSSVSMNAAELAGHGDPTAQGDGGGIYQTGGVLVIANSTVSYNHAGVTEPRVGGGYGGGIYSGGAELTITDSTITNNASVQYGGGVFTNFGTITSSTISNNTAGGQHDGIPYGRGGGISGDVMLTNSTVSGNRALYGGGIYGGGTIASSTISGNSANARGGSFYASGAQLEIGNSIINAGGPENFFYSGTVTSTGHNTCSDACGGYYHCF